MRAATRLLFALALPLAVVAADEREDSDLVRHAYEDRLYLFVKEKGERYLEQASYNQAGPNTQVVRYCLIAGAVERGAFEESLAGVREFEKRFPEADLAPVVQLLKARSLFEGYVQDGAPLPKEYAGERPAGIIARVRKEQAEKARRSIPEEHFARGLYVQGLDYFSLGDAASYRKANETLLELVTGHRRFPLIEDATFHLAQSYYFIDEFERALRFFKDLVEAGQKSKRLAEYVFWKGQCLFELKRLDEAHRLFDQALALDPPPHTRADLYYNLGWLFSYEGRNGDARECFRKLIMSPELQKHAVRYLDSARYKLASLLMIEKQYREGLAEILPVLESPILRHKAALLAGQFHYHLGEQEMAMERFKVADQSPDPIVRLEAEKSQALVFFDQGRYGDSQRILDELRKKEVPVDLKIDVMLQIAEVAFARGDTYTAQEIYQDLLQEKNSSLLPGLYYKLGQCSMKTHPLVELLFARQKLGLIPEKEIKAHPRIKLLLGQLDLVYPQLWELAGQQGAGLTRDRIIEIMLAVTGAEPQALNDEALKIFHKAISIKKAKEIELATDKRLSEEEKLAKAERIATAKFRLLCDKFSELYAQGKLPKYDDPAATLKELVEPHPELQARTVRAYLEKVLEIRSESPFQALAYHDLSRLLLDEGLVSDAIACLEKAVRFAGHQRDKTRFLYQLALTQYKAGGVPEMDAQARTTHIKSALANLNLMEELQPNELQEPIASLRFKCYRAIHDHVRAEETLQRYLSTGGPAQDRMEEQLIQYYFDLQQPLKAAQQKLRYAARLKAAQPELYQRQAFEAALVYQTHQDPDWIKKGEDLMLALAEELPPSEWTLRAALKAINILHARGKNDKANELAGSFAEPRDMSPELQMEKEMALAFHELALGRAPMAIQRFREVMSHAVAGSPLRAQAFLQVAELLRDSSPEESADVYHQFYYLFPEHQLREEALKWCLRLRIRNLQNKGGADEIRHKEEIRLLISKLSEAQDREKLISSLEGGNTGAPAPHGNPPAAP